MLIQQFSKDIIPYYTRYVMQIVFSVTRMRFICNNCCIYFDETKSEV
jgi:hypothetical protein